ncbi:MAG: hypothetical protein H0S80_09010 [Desulfovibrionaceae bacterium]|nr:hypothetical protein [Desulfovibrionaceae bacterium]
MTESTNTNHVPRFDSARESRRFIRNLVWVLAIGGLFLAGQGVRYGLNRAQLMEIRHETDKLYSSVLGPDIGGSPFGRLQFEHGKLMASRRIGLDPLGVLAALSRPAEESLRLEGLTLAGTTGRVRGVIGGGPDGFHAYMGALSDDEYYLFSLYKSDELGDDTLFILTVEPR